MATHCSILAWRIPWTEELGRLPRVIMSQTRLKRLNTHTRPSQSGNHQSAFSLYGFTYSGYFISVESCNVCAWLLSIQFPSIAQSRRTLCDPMDCSTPGFPVLHQLPELTQIHVHRVSDAIQPSCPLSPPFPPAFNLSHYQGFFLMSQLFALGGQSIGASASASVLPMNIQD